MKRYRPTPFLAGMAALHAAGAAALAVSPRHWPAVLGTLFGSHVVMAGVSLWPQSRLFGPNLSRLPEAAAARGEVALTLDDGPDPEVTPRVLDLLDRAGARASFFCIGRRVEARPDLAAEIVRRGHRIENHTWSHPNGFACYLPPAQRREIVRAQNAIEQAAGRAPELFRPPAGFRNPMTQREIFHAGLTLASWTRRGYDTVIREPLPILRRLLKGLTAGDVLLLHDGSAVTGGGNPVVLEVLPRLLDEIAARSLRFVPMSRSDDRRSHSDARWSPSDDRWSPSDDRPRRSGDRPTHSDMRRSHAGIRPSLSDARPSDSTARPSDSTVRSSDSNARPSGSDA